MWTRTSRSSGSASCCEAWRKGFRWCFQRIPGRGNLDKFGVSLGDRVVLTGPLPYMDFLNLWKGAKFVLTDSGGLQEETTALGVPCITVRENTELSITVE